MNIETNDDGTVTVTVDSMDAARIRLALIETESDTIRHRDNATAAGRTACAKMWQTEILAVRDLLDKFTQI